MTALARAQADLDRGDLGSARRRLASFIGSTGYSPDALTMAADISFKMRDPVQAGRYWILSPATGPDVETAIEAFATACHHDAHQMASELPRFPRRNKVAEYPDVVRERLARLGVDAVFRAQDPELMPVQKPRWQDRAKALGCLAAVVAVVVLVVLGVRALARGWCG